MQAPSPSLTVTFSAKYPYKGKEDFQFNPDNPNVFLPEEIAFIFSPDSKNLTFVDFISAKPCEFRRCEPSDGCTKMKVFDRDTDTKIDKISYWLVFKDENGTEYTTPDPQIINNPT